MKDFLHQRQGDGECCALIRHTCCCDCSPVTINNFFTDGEANTCSLKLLPGVETLEDIKNLLLVFFFKANAIIFYTDAQIILIVLRVGQ